MVHNEVERPVSVKKISLRIWSLKDEIKSVLKERLKANSDDKVNIQGIVDEYEGGHSAISEEKGEGLRVIQGGDEADDQEHQNQVQKKIGVSTIIKQFKPTGIPQGKMGIGTALISELNMEEIRFFSNSYFVPGQAVVIEFLVPQRFIVNADIGYCNRYKCTKQGYFF